MRNMILLGVAILGMTFSPLPLWAQEPDWGKIEIKVEKVAGNVYMLYGVGGFAGGNIGVSVGGDGVLLVDDQFELLVPKIEAALRAITPKPVRFVLNTHFHGDHTQGNRVFGRTATIIAHDNVRRRMDAPDDKSEKRAPPHALPIITFEQQVSVHLNGEEIRAIHFAGGHTDSDAIIYFTGSNVVHMGDDFFNGMFPYIDLGSGGSVRGAIAALEKVLPELKADVKIIPGHGPLATKADLQAYLTMLKQTVAIVEKGLQQGKSADQLKKDKVLAAYDAKWGGGYLKTDEWIDELANSLKGVAKNP